MSTEDCNSAPQEITIPSRFLPIKAGMRGVGRTTVLAKRGITYIQRAPRSTLYLAASLLVMGILIAFCPFENLVTGGAFKGTKLKYLICGLLLWSAFVSWLSNLFCTLYSERVITDPEAQTICFKGYNEETIIAWSDIVALQICFQPRSSTYTAGYQLNLVWLDAKRKVARKCLLKHQTRKFVIELGQQYSRAFGFKIVETDTTPN